MNIENIQFNRGAVSAGNCISQGLELAKQNYWMFFGISAVAFLLTGCLPVISWFLAGPVAVGIYYAFLRQLRGETVEFGNMFKGFNNFLPAMVIGFLISVPGIVSNTWRFSFRIAQWGAIYDPNEVTGAIAAILWIIGLVLGLFAIVGSFALGITLIFSFPLLAEHDLNFMETMRISAKAGWANAGGLFLLFLLSGLMAFAGILVFCIGIFFVIPLIYAALTVAYRQVFPDPGSGVSNTPPAPGEYGSDFGQPA